MSTESRLTDEHALSYSFGNQGAAQAQNLRDSGIPNDKIIVANRPDHYAEDAKSKGFNVEHDFGKAAKEADGEPIPLRFVCKVLTRRRNVQLSSCSSLIRFSPAFSTTRSRRT